jgi:phosphate transport system substrate-binding protein
MKGNDMKSRLVAIISTLSLGVGVLFAAPAWANATLTGAGSSYANKFMVGCDARTTDFTINYASVGSGAGRTQFGNGTVDFGASDAANPITLSGSRAGGKFTYVPVVGGPIAVLVNVGKIKSGELRLDAATIANIFKGNITKWNAKAIKKLQTAKIAAKLPNQSIQVVYRATSSGTSENFTDYMNQTAGSIWTSPRNGLIYSDAGIKAPAGSIGASNAQDLGTKVSLAKGRIGYADLADSVDSKGNPIIPVAKVKNANGKWVLPTSVSASKFLETFFDDEFDPKTGKVTLNFNKKVKGGYNLSLLAYAIVDKGVDANKVLASGATAIDVENWVKYLLKTCGPNYAAGLGYSPISGNLKTAALAIVAQITN